jgi:hypothetical protein
MPGKTEGCPLAALTDWPDNSRRGPLTLLSHRARPGKPSGQTALGVTRGRLIAAATFWAPVAALCYRTDLHFASEILVAPYSPLFAGIC